MPRNDIYSGITAFVQENKESIYRLAYSYVHNKVDAQDIVQEAICKALTSVRSLKNSSAMKAWFYRILVNTVIDFIRRNKKFVCLEADILEYESAISDSYRDLDLNNAINKLSTVNKTIIVLRFFEGLDLKEIACIMNKNLSTVKTALYSSLRKLRVELDEC